jgi:putative tryptophan/tyrosine transport system substrate-binding protein
MRRREFITLLGGTAAAWPRAARGQQAERMRRVGIVTSVLETDADAQARYAVLRQALQQLGWTEGRNIKFDQRFGSAGDSDVVRRHAQELVALAPDLIVASGSQNVAALQQVSRTVPIVFMGIVDPVGAGFVASLARPGGNTTGFTPFEYGVSGKWLELLKQIAPGMTRAAVLRDPSITAGVGQFAAIQSSRVASGRRARRGRNRARGRGVCASVPRWTDRDADRTYNQTSRSDQHTRRPAPFARSLPFPLLRHRRRPDLLRA